MAPKGSPAAYSDSLTGPEGLTSWGAQDQLGAYVVATMLGATRMYIGRTPEVRTPGTEMPDPTCQVFGIFWGTHFWGTAYVHPTLWPAAEVAITGEPFESGQKGMRGCNCVCVGRE